MTDPEVQLDTEGGAGIPAPDGAPDGAPVSTEGQEQDEAAQRLEELEARNAEQVQQIALLLEQSKETEAFRLEAEARARKAEVDATMQAARAFRDVGRRAHSPVLLNTCEAMLRLGEIPRGEDEEPIKLEAGDDGDVTAYFHRGIKYLLENLPGTIATAHHTIRSEERPGAVLEEEQDADKDELEEAWTDVGEPPDKKEE